MGFSNKFFKALHAFLKHVFQSIAWFLATGFSKYRMRFRSFFGKGTMLHTELVGKNMVTNRSLFRTQSNIQEGAFCEKTNRGGFTACWVSLIDKRRFRIRYIVISMFCGNKLGHGYFYQPILVLYLFSRHDILRRFTWSFARSE